MKCIWIQTHLLSNSCLYIRYVTEICQGKFDQSCEDLLPPGVCDLPFIKHEMKYNDMNRGQPYYTNMQCLTSKIDQLETQYQTLKTKQNIWTVNENMNKQN